MAARRNASACVAGAEKPHRSSVLPPSDQLPWRDPSPAAATADDPDMLLNVRCELHEAEAARLGPSMVGFKQRNAIRQCGICMQRFVAKASARHLHGEVWTGEYKAADKVRERDGPGSVVSYHPSDKPTSLRLVINYRTRARTPLLLHTHIYMHARQHRTRQGSASRVVDAAAGHRTEFDAPSCAFVHLPRVRSSRQPAAFARSLPWCRRRCPR